LSEKHPERPRGIQSSINWAPEALFPVVNRPWREVHHFPPSEIKTAWSYTSTHMKSWHGTSFSTRMAFRVPAIGRSLFLGTFAKLRKTIVSVSHLSFRPSVRVEQMGSHWTYCHDIKYFSICRNSVEKIQVSLKSDNNDGYVTCLW